jgi:hypothetical protein
MLFGLVGSIVEREKALQALKGKEERPNMEKVDALVSLI